MKDIEQEFKWNAGEPRAFERFLAALKKECESVFSRGKVRITDYYLDDEQGTLSARKIALRIRHSGQKWEATCKSRSQVKNGLAVRQERTLPLPQARSIKSALRALREQNAWKELPKEEVLHVRFKICNLRRVYMAIYKNCACEAALDNYVTLASGHQLRRKEIELELKKGSAENFRKLTQKLTKASLLKFAKISKVAGAEKWILQKFSLN